MYFFVAFFTRMPVAAYPGKAAFLVQKLKDTFWRLFDEFETQGVVCEADV